MPVLSAIKNTLFVVLLGLIGCRGQQAETEAVKTAIPLARNAGTNIVVGANRTDAYFPDLTGKRFALVANQTSVIFRSGNEYVHLADSLIASGLRPVRVFAPEHGFRGQADAGEHVEDGNDRRTGLPIISLYGSNRKPAQEQLQDLDLVVFDIQDVGVRFYTYIATLQLVMEACATAGIPVMVLDRPNPHANFIDGPMMEEAHTGFLGMTPIPLVYGMTIGEYAKMINGEGWLEEGLKADLRVVPVKNYARSVPYEIPIPPSPNLPNQQAVRLYPSLGLFEGTNVNAGRGTEHQFQSFGAPFLDASHFNFRYTPESNAGAKNPKHLGVSCIGRDLRAVTPPMAVDLKWLIEAYQYRTGEAKFFNTAGFTRHAGTEDLQKQIESGMGPEAIRQSWEASLQSFNKIRKKYLIYP